MLLVGVSCVVCVCLPVLDVDEYLCFPCDRIWLVFDDAGASVQDPEGWCAIVWAEFSS